MSIEAGQTILDSTTIIHETSKALDRAGWRMQ
jgi:hypothetical protein